MVEVSISRPSPRRPPAAFRRGTSTPGLPMETSEITEAVREQATVHQAEGVLAVVLGVPTEQAAVSLDLKAQFGGVSLVEAARRVLADHERRLGDTGTVPSELGDRTLTILRQHLDTVGSPLEQPS